MPAANIAIRGQRADDRDGIGELHRLAFAGGAEARLVDDLRRSGDAVISLVAECSGAIVGHVLFGRLQAPLRSLALAPLAVRPERQGQGIGSALVRAGLEQADREAWKAVFVLGAPDSMSGLDSAPKPRKTIPAPIAVKISWRGFAA